MLWDLHRDICGRGRGPEEKRTRLMGSDHSSLHVRMRWCYTCASPERIGKERKIQRPTTTPNERPQKNSGNLSPYCLLPIASSVFKLVWTQHICVAARERNKFASEIKVDEKYRIQNRLATIRNSFFFMYFVSVAHERRVSHIIWLLVITYHLVENEFLHCLSSHEIAKITN